MNELTKIKNITIVGGGSLGHVISGYLAYKGYVVSVLTRRPSEWDRSISIHKSPNSFSAQLECVTSNPEVAIKDADVVLLTVPGYANESELRSIAPFLKSSCYVGGVFCSSGFFFEAFKWLPENIKLWGFQRVPFIARVEKYGHSANLLGTKSHLNIAVERANPDEKHDFRKWIEEAFETPASLSNNYLEVSITNSNPIIHTARLFSMFGDWTEDMRADHNILFYEEWSCEASDLAIKMDEELFRIIQCLPVDKSYLVPLLEYYESHDAESLKKKIASIQGFKGITSPMIKDENGWKPDYNSRYFTEDFGYSLRYIWELGQKHNVDMPYIDMVYKWGKSKIG